ncbi:MAG: entericidin A/B family lipoprotein [Pseudomonadota bacterium]|nr:entericidin A/B family lipoprotein [Pseudomonadota bacterium]
MKRTLALLMTTAYAAMLLSACNTMAGAGQDVQKAGEKIEDSAKKK